MNVNVIGLIYGDRHISPITNHVLEKKQIPYARDNKHVLIFFFRTFSGAFFQAVVIFERCLFPFGGIFFTDYH